MEQYAIGFWGCFFGSVVLMLVGSAIAFIHSLRRVSLNAALSAIASAFFVLAFLGVLPVVGVDSLPRFLAHVASLVSAVLAYLLFSMLGLLGQPATRYRTIAALVVLAGSVILIGWLLPAPQALALSATTTCLLGIVALLASVRSALRGDRLAWAAVAGVSFMLIALVGLSWIALDRAGAPWQIHAISAFAGTAYVATMSAVMWIRYAYLIELHQVLAYGPSYDPVTRMRSHSETGNMVGTVFKHYRNDPVPLGVIVVTIANLSVLEKLYGLAAVNHALFVCAGRLRRIVPAHVEMGRIAGDGFLLLMRNCVDSGVLIALARAVQTQLSRSVVLDTSFEAGARGRRKTCWAAEVGAGVLRVSRVDARAATAVAMGRGMSRTAWSYPSRIAWYDDKSGEIVGMPVVAN